MNYKPPYQITNEILNLVAEISLLLGHWTASNETLLSPKLRRGNRLRTIQASLAIENNTLTLEQVTAVIAGKKVLGLPREIQEVKNAFDAYELLPKLEAVNVEHLLAAHKIMMHSLMDGAGSFRQEGVGVYKGDKLIHMAPPASRVQLLMNDLVKWLKDTDSHPLIASCVFHYEFEYIHPFADGNGRMGRLWQTLYLSQWQKLFEYLPVETVIKERQDEYYQALAASDKASNSNPFIIFMLNALLSAMKETSMQEIPDNKANSAQVGVQVSAQVNTQIKPLLNWLNGKEPQKLATIMTGLALKHRATFKKNYITPALTNGFIALTHPDSPRSPQQKYYLTTLGESLLNKTNSYD